MAFTFVVTLVSLVVFAEISGSLSLPHGTQDSRDQLQDGANLESIYEARSAGLAYALGAALSRASLSNDARLRLRDFSSGQIANSKAIVVIGADFDEAENVLSAVGLDFVKTRSRRIEDHLKEPCSQIVIINSGAKLRRRQRQALRRFVRRGGVVLSSDLAGNVLSRTFPGRRLKFRKVSQLDRRGPTRVVPAPLGNSSAGVRNGSCAVAREVAEPFQQVLLHNFLPLWHLDGSSRALNLIRARGVHVLARSDDLRAPHDGIISCFDHKRGSVFFTTGRLFQHLSPLERPHTSTDDRRLTSTELRQIFAQMEISAFLPSSIQEKLLRYPPTIGQLTSSRLSTGFMLQLLTWRSSRAC